MNIERIVTLRSGGVVHLKVWCDLFTLSKEDREWVMALLDVIKAYEGSHKEDQPA